MAQLDRQTAVMRQYLLGTLSEVEQEALETQYLGDDTAFEDMVRVENELVDSYVQGRLGAEERGRFEKHYMAHPDRRERVKFAAALQKKIQLTRRAEATAQQPAESDSLWQKMLSFLRGENLGLVGACAAAMLVVVMGVYFYVRPGQGIGPDIATVSPPPRIETPSPVLPPSVLPGSSPTPNTSPTKGNGSKKPSELPTPILPPDQSHTPVITQPTLPQASAFLLLTPGTSAQQSATLKLSKVTQQVRLQLNLAQPSYATYRATVRGSGGQEIWTQQNIAPRPTNEGVAFTFLLPASYFLTGTYQLSLSGVSDNGDVTEVTKSFFKIEKK